MPDPTPENRIDAFDRKVRIHVYMSLVQRAVAPTVAETAEALRVPPGEVEAAYRRLDAAHSIVLQPSTCDIRFAAPFSAVSTAFTVQVGEVRYSAPCAWDALGIAAALDADATIHTTCGDCGEAVTVAVRDRAVSGDAEVVHCHVPASRWWDDIAFT